MDDTILKVVNDVEDIPESALEELSGGWVDGDEYDEDEGAEGE